MSMGEQMANNWNLASVAASRKLGAPPVDVPAQLCALPRGEIAEIVGEPCSGRTALAQSMLATATLGGEVSALVDGDDAFDPASAQRAGAELAKLLWVQCGHRLDAALKATDMILHAGGFGLIVLDVCDILPRELNRVPISFWYRCRRALEHTSSVLLIVASAPIAGSCAARQISLERKQFRWAGSPPFQTIERLEIRAASRKPPSTRPVDLEAAWEA